MRFLGIGDYLSLGALYLRLIEDGHELRVFVAERDAHEILAGDIPRTEDWRAELDWIRAAGDDGIVVLETATMGAAADALRRDGFHVIGGSEWADRLENDRAFGQQVLADAGMRTAPVHEFSDFDAALAFLARRPARYVFKLNDPEAASTRNYVGEMDDATDVAALLRLERARASTAAGVSFVLMEHLRGVEVGIGAYFDGERFLEPAVIDWEHKRFFPGDLGELTGEMGTIVSYRGSERLFALTLGRLRERFRAARHVGYVNLNTIVNDDGVWPLEFTSRFGYPGFAVCDALHVDDWATLFRRMALRDAPRFATLPGFAAGVVLTVPPFPYEYGYAKLSKGLPILFRDPPGDEDRRHLHFGEVAQVGGTLVASGSLGYLMVVTGTGADVPAAQRAAYARVRNVVVPNLRYRTDIGDRLVREDLATLARLGIYGTPSSAR
jgi:phosphoribosylamine---glycine ligase